MYAIDFRDRSVAAPLKRPWRLARAPRNLHFRDRSVAAPLKRSTAIAKGAGHAYFRDRSVAAPLKRSYRWYSSLVFLVFPRPIGRGPIEACSPRAVGRALPLISATDRSRPH